MFTSPSILCSGWKTNHVDTMLGKIFVVSSKKSFEKILQEPTTRELTYWELLITTNLMSSNSNDNIH